MASGVCCPACRSADLYSAVYPEGVIHGCRRCKLQWAERAVPVAGECDVTGVHQRYMHPESIDCANYEPFATFFQHLISLGKTGPQRILDIGCGGGAFLGAARDREHQVMGIEIDERLATMMPAAVLPLVRFGAAEEVVPTLDQEFDVITFWDAFEHIDKPFALLECLRPRLAADGIVFLRVNNRRDVFNLTTSAAMALAPASVWRPQLKRCFNLPYHAWNFSIIGMTALLQQHGWTILHQRATDTPAGRLTANPLTRLVFEAAYLTNRLIGGGKIGEYFIGPTLRMGTHTPN